MMREAGGRHVEIALAPAPSLVGNEEETLGAVPHRNPTDHQPRFEVDTGDIVGREVRDIGFSINQHQSERTRAWTEVDRAPDDQLIEIDQIDPVVARVDHQTQFPSRIDDDGVGRRSEGECILHHRSPLDQNARESLAERVDDEDRRLGRWHRGNPEDIVFAATCLEQDGETQSQ
jgi:hypothetical protein